MPAPLPNSILPNKRIIAFYGNPLSTRMGILGEFEPQEMLRKLDEEVAEWNRADPKTPVQPALHLIAEVANPHPGPSGKYRTRMDSTMIEKVYGWAKSGTPCCSSICRSDRARCRRNCLDREVFSCVPTCTSESIPNSP